jgi:hypothetical protein
MARLVYFVVAVDLDAKSVFVDDDVFTARFGEDEQVFDDVSGEWSGLDWDDEFLPAQAILNARLSNRMACPNHKGSFDCTPFCELCQGEQEIEGVS